MISLNAFLGRAQIIRNNDIVQSLDNMQMKGGIAGCVRKSGYGPTASLICWTCSRFAGYGVSGTGFYGLRIENDNDFSMYKGGSGTGQVDGAVGLQIDGPFAFGMRVQQPVQRGHLLEGFPNQMCASGQGDNTHFFIQDDGPGGNPGFAITYNCNTGNSLISSGTGDGIVSAISMTPTSIAVNANGPFSLKSTTVTMNALQGVGTRAVTASATGALGTAPLATVTSVALTTPSWATGGGTITTSGTFNLGLPAFIGSGASHAPGIVPDPGATASTTRFLREDGSWAVPITGFTGKCTSPQTPTFTNGIATGCS